MRILPGPSHPGPLPDPTSQEARLRSALAADIEELAGGIGERHLDRPEALERAALFVENRLGDSGLRVSSEHFRVGSETCRNLIADVGPPGPRLLRGAHYDTVPGSPGADDNASGVAGLLALAAELGGRQSPLPLRVVAFVNEEPPYFQSEAMGSRIHARSCSRQGIPLLGAVALDGLGYYRDEPGTQTLPLAPEAGAIPDTGNFLALVANPDSSPLLEHLLEHLGGHASLPVYGAVLLEWVPGATWSDHWAFWQEGWPGVMATDTLPFRNPDYHGPGDQPERLDLDRLARSVAGLADAGANLAGPHA
ncbi:M28 family peptidase [Thiohalorhabdus sp.]|uniref:M28 family peptidase n=1 Tax=Thiohalorhabdus sp. TaxID=3094134 RepID=UPI002FC36BE4